MSQSIAAKPVAAVPASPAVSFGQSSAVVVAASLFVALCAHVSVPLFFTPVPLTLQPFPILLIGLLLGPGPAFLSLALYLLEGAMGLPVFSPHGPGGILQLLGPTGGYLMSYPFAAAVTGWLRARTGRNLAGGIFAAAVGSFVVLLGGAAWFAQISHLSLSKVAAMSLLPFLPGDALKVLAAAGAATGWFALRNRAARP